MPGLLTAQHRLLLAALTAPIFLVLHWPMAAAAAACATLVQAALLLDLDGLAVMRAWLQQPRLPRWLVVLLALAAGAVLIGSSGFGAGWALSLPRWLLAQQTLLSDLSQIAIAALALVVTLRQFSIERVILKELNLITQAQLVDNFIQGISEMVSDGDGFLEDWPLERMLAEGRLSALIGGVDPTGCARVLRFLSHASLLTPLQRDQRVGRPMLDGQGGYLSDRLNGVPVVQLRQLLVGVNLAYTDLRGVDFNGAISAVPTCAGRIYGARTWLPSTSTVPISRAPIWKGPSSSTAVARTSAPQDRSCAWISAVVAARVRCWGAPAWPVFVTSPRRPGPTATAGAAASSGAERVALWVRLQPRPRGPRSAAPA